MAKKPDFKLDYSKLIRADDFSIKAIWTGFSHVIMPPNAGKDQINDMRMSFYAGFTECFKIINDYASGLPEDDAFKLFTKIAHECNEFVEKALEDAR